jgi:hypothetical protein
LDKSRHDHAENRCVPGQLFGELIKRGYVAFPTTNAYALVDVIDDFLRHSTGAVLDMRRVPSDLKAACDVIVGHVLKVATAIPPTSPVTFFFILLHLNKMLLLKL